MLPHLLLGDEGRRLQTTGENGSQRRNLESRAKNCALYKDPHLHPRPGRARRQNLGQLCKTFFPERVGVGRFRRVVSLYMLVPRPRVVTETFQRESALDRIFNRLMGRAVRLGIGPGYMRLLEVRGRKSGRIFTTPVNVLEFQGRRWIVAARGETAWARNARAAGRVVLRRGASSESLAVRELADADKAEVIKAFVDRFASQVQRFFDARAGSPADAFAAAAPRTPVFELIGDV
jgi:deazaflavin-dependent oxidoreductase (nitroreductase family)